MPVFMRFLAAHGCNTLNIGIQIVLLAWLAVGVMKLPPISVGWVQAAVLVPNILMLAVAGRWVERANACVVARSANFALAFVHLSFWWLLGRDAVGLPELILYAALLGLLNALVQNARETLLGRLSSLRALQKHISSVAFVQFGAQALGVSLGMLFEWFDVRLFIAVQALLCLLAGVLYGGARLLHKARRPRQLSPDPSLRYAIRSVARIAPLRTMLLVIAFNGFTHMGFFLVLLPLLATRTLGYSSSGYASLQLAFIMGSILISGRLMFGRPVTHAGQHVLFAALYTGGIGFALAAGPKPAGLYLLIFCWGVVAGASANLSRLVVQSLAPENLRARTMSLYQTALFGSAPLGALFCGQLVELTGTLVALKVMAVASCVLFAVVVWQKSLWQFTGSVEAETQPGSPRH